MMDKRELNARELDMVSGGNWLNDISDFFEDAADTIADGVEEVAKTTCDALEKVYDVINHPV